MSSRQRSSPHSSPRLLSQAAGDDLAEFVAHPDGTTAFEQTGLRGVAAMGDDCLPQFGDSGAVSGDGGDDRWAPTARGVMGWPLGRPGEVEHLLEVPAGRLGAITVGLVDDEDVGDLHQPGLVRLHAVPPSGVDDDDRGVRLAGDLDLDLADPDRLDHNQALAEGVEQAHGLRGGQGEAAEVAAGSHRANEHAGIGGVILHSHPIAEDRPTGERR